MGHDGARRLTARLSKRWGFVIFSRSIRPPPPPRGLRRSSGVRILVIEDDAETAAYLQGGLQEEGHVVTLAADGRNGLMLAATGDFDVLVVDRMLPGLDGLAVRVKALGRRPRATAATTTVLRVAELELDLIKRTVRRAGQPIALQPREFRLLEYLMRHAGEVVTRTMLLENVWDYHFDPRTNIVESHLSRLRTKVEKGFAPELIHTLRGAGYCLREPG